MPQVFADVVPGAVARVNVCKVGFMGNNVYVIENAADPADCFVVDPTSNAEFILLVLAGRIPKAIVCTHYHFDHVGAAAELRAATAAPVYASAIDAPRIQGEVEATGLRRVTPCPVDVQLEGGEELVLAGIPWKVMLTPGHSPGSLCLFSDAPARTGLKPLLVAGDTLFDGNIGRTDFADGSMTDMLRSLTVLRELPADTCVLTGHESLTTIDALERSVFTYYLGPRN